MSLKYKLDDVVVLGENVDTYKSFTPGAKVRIGELCNAGTDREHYTIYTLGNKDGQWWVSDSEINHEATKELQESNESGYLVQKISVENDDSSERESQPSLSNNAWSERGELPPIGSICEHEPSGFSNEWFSVEVLAHKEFKGHDTGLLVVFATEDDVSFSSGECFRPIKTAEEIAEEQRQNTINKMLEIIKGSCALFDAERAKVEALYAAGLRFVGEDK